MTGMAVYFSIGSRPQRNVTVARDISWLALDRPEVECTSTKYKFNLNLRGKVNSVDHVEELGVLLEIVWRSWQDYPRRKTEIHSQWSSFQKEVDGTTLTFKSIRVNKKVVEDSLKSLKNDTWKRVQDCSMAELFGFAIEESSTEGTFKRGSNIIMCAKMDVRKFIRLIFASTDTETDQNNPNHPLTKRWSGSLEKTTGEGKLPEKLGGDVRPASLNKSIIFLTLFMTVVKRLL